LHALADRLQRAGGTLRAGAQVALVTPGSDRVTVHLADGAALTAEYAIVTAGPWVHDVLPELHLPVRATRQQVCYLDSLDPLSFGVGHFPVFLADMVYYGLPLQGPGWLKVASHRFGATVNPNIPYTPDAEEIASVRAFLRQTIPAAADAPLAQMDLCMYDVTPDEDFILDYHPDSRRIIIGSGFSGHGLKFGVVVGELLAALALDQPATFPLDRFRLARFAR
jgi:glycine/D-amino acid oxidase-like deaminating enzyme